jgi:SAM-dependent methyltransferase
MLDDGRRWNERYAGRQPPEPRAPDAVQHWSDLVSLLPTSGRCVDVACGSGATSLWLARRGLHVTALDLSDVALGLLTAAASASGLSARIETRTVDLDHGLPDDLSELDLIVCQRFRDPTLYGAMVDRLRHDGLAIVTVLSSVGVDDPGAFHADPGELTGAFGADERCDIVHDVEADGVAHIVVRRCR